MANPVFSPDRALGLKLTKMDRQELCSFISDLCRTVVAEVGSRGRRGGIYPENISLDEDGGIAIGPAGQSPWAGQELDFIAPELYWSGQLSAASDVYSVGLLLFYAVNEGRLPLEGVCEDPQLRRMGGGNPRAPKAAGRRLGEIIEKCIRFKASERYQTLEELRAVIDSCVKNLYLSGVPSAEAIFRKHDDDLNDIERMMVDIMEQDGEETAAQDAGEEDPFLPEPPEDGVKVYDPSQKNQKDVISAAQADMLVQKMKASSSPAVPKHAGQEEAELEPVTLSKAAAASSPAVQYRIKTDRERKIAEEVKKRRRRPLAVILVLCAVLVMVAIIMNAMLRDFEEAKKQPDNRIEPVSADPYAQTMPPTAEDPESTGYPITLEDLGGATSGPSVHMDIEVPDVEVPAEHGYQIIKKDVSWTVAQAECQALGGHLVVIDDEAEFEEIVRLAEANGISRVWIGCHRDNDGKYLWEGKDPSFEGYFRWAKGEPTYVDTNDQVSENYIMLWNHNGWACNDNRDDPCHDYPDFYSGTMGYVCEFND